MQPDSVVVAEEGDDVTLPCFHPKEQINKVLWYKQLVGKKPLLVASSYYHSMPIDFHNDFDKSQRFNLARAAGSSNLTILKVEPSDLAVYFCAGSFSNVIRFGAGTVLVLKGEWWNMHLVRDSLIKVSRNMLKHHYTNNSILILESNLMFW